MGNDKDVIQKSPIVFILAPANKYGSILTTATNEFNSVIDDLKSSEEDKLENLPEILKEASQGSNIQEAIDCLEEIEGNLESIENAWDEIADAAQAKVKYTENRIVVPVKNDGPRRNRFQILLSDRMISLLKSRASQLGISCNELICQSLDHIITKV